LLVEADEEAAHALPHVPVEGAEVVARGVVAVVGELDAGARLARAALGAHRAGEDPLRDDGERLELALELVVEEILVGARGRAPAGPTARGPALAGEEIEESHGGGGARAQAVSGTVFRMAASTASVFTPSASPSKLRRTRWRSAGSA